MHRSMISPCPVGSSNNGGSHPRVQQQLLDDSFRQPYLIVPEVEGTVSCSNQNVDDYDDIDDVDFAATIESSINVATRWVQEGTTFGGNDGRRPMMMMSNNQDWDIENLNFQDNEEQEQGIGSFIGSSPFIPENGSSLYYSNDENEDEDFDFFEKQDFDDICMQQNDILLPSKMNSSMNDDFAQGFSGIEKIMSSSLAMQQLSGIPTAVLSGEQQSSTGSSQSTSQHQNDATAMTTSTASSSSAAAAVTSSQERRKAQIRASLIQRHYCRLQLIRRQRMELRRQMLIARAKRQMMFRRRQQQRMKMIMALKQRRAHALVASRLRHQQQQHMLNNVQPNDQVNCWDESFDHDDEHRMYNNTTGSYYHQQRQDYPTEISVSINTAATDDSNTSSMSNNNNGCNSSVVDDGVSALTHPVELVSSSPPPPSFRRPVVSRSSSMNNVVDANTMNSTIMANAYHRMMQQQQQQNALSDNQNNKV